MIVECEGVECVLLLSTEAWTEQSEESKERLTSDDDEEEEAPIVTSQSPGQPDVQSASTSYTSINEDDEQGLVVTSPLSPLQPSFFLTDRQISRSLDFEETELINDGGCGLEGVA